MRSLIRILLLVSILYPVTALHNELSAEGILNGQAQDTIKFDSLLVNIGKDDVAKADSSVSMIGELKPPSISKIISFGKIFWAVVFIAIGYIVIRFLTTLLQSFAERKTKYRIAVKGIIPIIRIIGWIFITFIIIAGIFQPPVSTVLAVTASIGIAVGFASQDILKNIFGGIMILFDRPFQVGDKIEIGEYYGEVIEIGLRSIRIVTPDDSVVSVPNGEIMNKPVSNANSGEANCQVVAEIYLPITADTERIRQVAIEAAQVSKYVFLNKPIVVLFFNEIKEKKSYLKMRLKAYVSDIRYEFAFKSDMTEIVIKELLNEKLITPEDFN